MAGQILRFSSPRRADRQPPVAAPAEQAGRGVEAGDFLLLLLSEGVLGAHGLIRALALRAEGATDIAETLLAEGMVTETDLAAVRAKFHGLPLVDPLAKPPDPRLIDLMGAETCLRLQLLPWRRTAEGVVLLSDRADALPHHRDRLPKALGPVTLALAPRGAIMTAIARARGADLAQAAEVRTAPEDSCRTLPAPQRSRAALALLGGGLGLILAQLLLPGGALLPLTLLALLALLANTGLKAAALIALLRRRDTGPAPPVIVARLPTVSVLVALYREADIAPRLVRRLGQIDYPREKLDLLLAVEADDDKTLRALTAAGLPAWMRIVPVPPGSLRTKPRALNYALSFCRGRIIGVYDAEDAPEAGQIRAVVDRFHRRGPQVACLQGVLDYYNPQTNWIARCFTMEYAAWFRVILPGIERLGLPVPLGGTTLFFRREALEALGAWDAHNVTEDADLGIRLARRGYRTELIETVTGEEANCLPLPWVRQRSRWIKGYMMTWRQHMRDPRRLWRDLGPRGFIGFQLLFLGSLMHALLAPLILSFWAASLGLGHPVVAALPWPVFLGLVALLLLCEAINVTIGVIALRRRRAARLHPLWLLTLHFYHPLASLAAIKALWEMLFRPFYWDKTRHGRFDRGLG